MSTQEELGAYQTLAVDMDALLRDRVEVAVAVEHLSHRGGKILDVVEEANGNRFVRRSYTERGINQLFERIDLRRFGDAWGYMNGLMDAAAIDVVPSVVLEDVGDYPVVVASEYLGDAIKMKDAPTSTKEEAAKAFGRLMVVSGNSSQVMSGGVIGPDLFVANPNMSGGYTPKLIDIDPILEPNGEITKDSKSKFFIAQVADVIVRHWCPDIDERQQVIKAFVSTVMVDVCTNYKTIGLTRTNLSRMLDIMYGMDPDGVNLLGPMPRTRKSPDFSV